MRTWIIASAVIGMAMSLVSCVTKTPQSSPKAGTIASEKYDRVFFEFYVRSNPEKSEKKGILVEPIYELYIDGKFVLSLEAGKGSRLPLDAGEHKILIKAEGYEPWDKTITLSPYVNGQTFAIDLKKKTQ